METYSCRTCGAKFGLAGQSDGSEESREAEQYFDDQVREHESGACTPRLERECLCGHYTGAHADGVGPCTPACGCQEFRAVDPALPYIDHDPAEDDPVNHPGHHPGHYTSHPSGVECIQITEHMGFNLGNALKYIWRADEKGNALEDLQKARWYIGRELQRRAEQ